MHLCVFYCMQSYNYLYLKGLGSLIREDLTKRIPLKSLLWLNAALLGLSLPLWQSSNALAQECTRAEIRANIEQFKDEKRMIEPLKLSVMQ